MSRFLLGDELGNIKILRYSPDASEESKTSVTTVYHPEASAGAIGVQQLANSSQGSGKQQYLAAAFSDGSCFVSAVKEDDTFEVLSEWKEPRIVGSKFIGTSLTESSAFTCTSNGMLRKTIFNVEDGDSEPQVSRSECGTLPSRLCDWRLSEDSETFAYGGDEVDLSLGLRQPIRITALSYLSSSPSGHHLITGTQFGDIRRYDTRAARRPVSNWTGIGKVGGVKAIQKGLRKSAEFFMSDNGSNLYSIDLRTGGILYSYKGISGAVTSIAPSPNIMASTSLDRFARVHSIVAPPSGPGSHQERKGTVLEKSYLTCVPTAIVWDKCISDNFSKESSTNEDDEVWDNMENVS
ncbi:hypothetical protein BDZ97DRAFT_1906298 [Flammula alnicola]|nr:hypothetical protein BDZ97DRAFT_1906298 [Flammula alnicola]